MVWLTRAYGDVQVLAHRVKRYWTGWAWLGWIVPILYLFRPKQVVNDVWHASHGDPPGWVLTWWRLWLVAELGTQVAGRFPTETLEQIRTLDAVDGVLNVVAAVAGVLAIRMVRRITELQDEHAERERVRRAPSVS